MLEDGAGGLAEDLGVRDVWTCFEGGLRAGVEVEKVIVLRADAVDREERAERADQAGFPIDERAVAVEGEVGGKGAGRSRHGGTYGQRWAGDEKKNRGNRQNGWTGGAVC